MKVEKVVTGFLEENCYILSSGNNSLVIDPGADYDKIRKSIGNNNVLAVLITHYHFDHIGALSKLFKEFDTRIIDYKSKRKQKINKFSFSIIPTPGHTKDSVTFYFADEKIMFTGDFLFNNSIGRTDLDPGNIYEMKDSLELIKKYDRDIKIYPGHGEDSTLGYEFEKNIFMR